MQPPSVGEDCGGDQIPALQTQLGSRAGGDEEEKREMFN